MKRFHPLLLLFPGAVLALFLLAGCTAADSPAGESSRRFFSIGTAPPGGTFFVVGSAIAELYNETRGEDGWQVSSEATKGSQENIRRLVSGDLDLALANSAITYFAVQGAGGWDREYPVRTVATLAPNVGVFVTPASSGVESFVQLRSQRVVVGVQGAGFEYFLRPILEAHGLTYDDFTPLYNTQTGAVNMLADGSAVAAFLGGAVPSPSITQATTAQDIRFIPFDPGVRDQLAESYPFLATAVIPAGTYRGQEADFPTLNVGSMHLIASADADEELVYQMTRTLYENREQMAARHPVGRALNPTNAVRNTGTVFHPGAIRYYREIGIWPGEGEGSSSSGAP